VARGARSHKSRFRPLSYRAASDLALSNSFPPSQPTTVLSGSTRTVDFFSTVSYCFLFGFAAAVNWKEDLSRDFGFIGAPPVCTRPAAPSISSHSRLICLSAALFCIFFHSCRNKSRICRHFQKTPGWHSPPPISPHRILLSPRRASPHDFSTSLPHCFFASLRHCSLTWLPHCAASVRDSRSAINPDCVPFAVRFASNSQEPRS